MNLKKVFLSLCLTGCFLGINPAVGAERIPSDPAVDTFILTGLTRGMTIEALVTQAMQRAPAKTRAIIARGIQSRPEKAAQIIALAIRGGFQPEEAVRIGISLAPQQAGQIVGFALRAAPSEAGKIAQVAVDSGVDPQAIAPIFNTYLSQDTAPVQQLASINEGRAPAELLDPTPPPTTTAELAPPAIATPMLVVPPARGGTAPVASPN